MNKLLSLVLCDALNVCDMSRRTKNMDNYDFVCDKIIISVHIEMIKFEAFSKNESIFMKPKQWEVGKENVFMRTINEKTLNNTGFIVLRRKW